MPTCITSRCSWSHWRRSNVEYIQADELQEKPYDSRLMKRLLRYLAPYKRMAVFSVLLLAVESLLELAPPFLTKMAIDRYLTPAGHVALDVRFAGLLKVVLILGAALIGRVVSCHHRTPLNCLVCE